MAPPIPGIQNHAPTYLLRDTEKSLEAIVRNRAITNALFRAELALTVLSLNRREPLERCHPRAPGMQRQFYAMSTAASHNDDTMHK